MLLAIDVGNTETLVGVFQGEELNWHWRYSTVGNRTPDELALLLGGFLEQQGLSFTRQITGVSIASVVPDQTQALRTMVRRYFHFQPVVVEPGTKTGISILYDNPKDGLADLIVADCVSVQHHEPWLTLEGLRLIFERNAVRDE